MKTTFAAMLALGAIATAQKSEDSGQIAKGMEAPGHYGTTTMLASAGSDDCTNAAASNTLVGVGTFPVNTVGATTGVAPFQPQTTSTIKNDVWFYWVAPSTGTASLETCNGVTVDTKVASWLANNGTSCPSGTSLAYNDDACALQSRISWSVTAGTAYFLQLGAFTEGVTYSGTFTLAVLTPPSNDICSAPSALSGNGPHNFDTTLASTGSEGQTETLCLNGTTTGIARDIWFTWTAPNSGRWAVSTIGGTTLDTKVAVYASSGCPVAGTAIACNDDAVVAQSIASFNTTAGATYLVQLGQDPTNTAVGGTGTFQFVDVANDSCASPVNVVGDGPHNFATQFATTGTEGQTETLCLNGTTTGIARDMWFTWTATATGLRAVSTIGGTTLDTKIAVYPAGGCPTAGTAIACNDDLGTSTQSQANFNAVAGTTYLIQLGQDPTNTTAGGSGTWRIVDPTPPANDNCAQAVSISGAGPFPYNTTFSTTGTEGQTEAICLFFNQTAIWKDLWFTWTASTSGTVTVSNCGQFTSATTDTKLAVYQGAGCPTTAALACNDDAGATLCAAQTLSSNVSFTAVCGQVYTIQIGNYSNTASITGTFTVTESGTPCVAGTAYCFGDGSGTACPCGNNSVAGAGEGCLSSLGIGGKLGGSGNASIAGDSLVLAGSGMPNSNALYFQGTTQIAAVFGDGIRCAGGSVIRLGTKTNVAGASAYPATGDLSVSARGLVTAPGVRNYQVWYRNAAAFCTASTFNLTNGYSVTWNP